MPDTPPRLDRRDFLRVLAWTGGGALAGLSVRAGAGLATPARGPNAVVIVTDADCRGAAELDGWHLRELARTGARFTRFYVGEPALFGSRVPLLTGCYPHRASRPGSADGPKGGRVTLAEALRHAGYRTGCFGTWRFDRPDETGPSAQGFDEFFGWKEGCIDDFGHLFSWSGPSRHELWRNDEPVRRSAAFLPELIVREARRFLGENRDRPFFLYLPMGVARGPLPPARSRAALSAQTDARIGQILAVLEELSLRENTLVVFFQECGRRFDLREGGIRMPCLAALPGIIPAGVLRHQSVHVMDWTVTIAQLCGAAMPARHLDGCGLVDVLRLAGADQPHEALHWRQGRAWAVQQGRWKLLAEQGRGAGPPVAGPTGGEPGRLFLGDLHADPDESKNLAAEQPAVVASLRRLHEDWVADLQKQQ